MKECPFCNFENFTHLDICENCNYPITVILQDNFNIAVFLKKNYQIYAIFGILLALFEYIMKEAPSEEKIVGLLPLIVAFYLILYLLQKSFRVVMSRIWNSSEEFLRRDCSFQLFIFYLIHVSLVISLLVILPESQRNFMGFLVGAFIFIIYFASDFTNNQIRKELLILLSSILSFEIALFLFLIIPFVAKIPGSDFFASYYGWIVSVLLYLSTGGLIAFTIIIYGYNGISNQRLNLSLIALESILSQERENGHTFIDWLLTLDLFIGTFLITILFCLKDFYRGL
jgi:hypothetical protein